MTQTTNLQLNKPNTKDFYDITVQNDNMDILDEFCGRTDNPHNVTKSQVGLGNVPNVSTNDQTPTYSVASSNATLASGEKLSVAFSKIAKAVSTLISHIADKNNPHGVTASQIGARPTNILLCTNAPATWTEVWGLGSGSYTWVQSEKLAWQPGETPNGALRVVLIVDMLAGQSYVARMLYVDGITNGKEYVAEADSTEGGRWTRVYNNRNKPTAFEIGAVQMGGGVGQNTNSVAIGWSGNALKATVDNTDLGEFIFAGGADTAILPISKGGTGAGNATTARTNLGAAPAYTYSTTDLSAGASSLETGKIYIVYE